MKPKLLVCLGATAAQAIFGPSFRVTRERGKVLSSKFAPRVLATVHPSSLLRQPDEESRHREYKNFVNGEWVASATGKTFENRNPADGEDLIGTFQESNSEDLNRAVDAADGAFNGFPIQHETGAKSFFVPKLCNHCVDSPCVQACPVGATFDSPDGVVLGCPTGPR